MDFLNGLLRGIFPPDILIQICFLDLYPRIILHLSYLRFKQDFEVKVKNDLKDGPGGKPLPYPPWHCHFNKWLRTKVAKQQFRLVNTSVCLNCVVD